MVPMWWGEWLRVGAPGPHLQTLDTTQTNNRAFAGLFGLLLAGAGAGAAASGGASSFALCTGRTTKKSIIPSLNHSALSTTCLDFSCSLLSLNSCRSLVFFLLPSPSSEAKIGTAGYLVPKDRAVDRPRQFVSQFKYELSWLHLLLLCMCHLPQFHRRLELFPLVDNQDNPLVPSAASVRLHSWPVPRE